MSEPLRARRGLGRHGWTIAYVVLGLILLASIALAISLVLPPDLEPVPIPSVSAV